MRDSAKQKKLVFTSRTALFRPKVEKKQFYFIFSLKKVGR